MSAGTGSGAWPRGRVAACVMWVVTCVTAWHKWIIMVMPCTTLTSHHGGINRRYTGLAESRADKVESFTFYTYKVYIREAENLLVFLQQMADKLPITIISAVQNLSANKLIVNLCKLHYIHRFTYNETCIVHCASVHSLFCCHGDSVLQNLSYPRVSVVMVMPVSLLGGGRHWSVLNYGC